jgi:hypothetical protein
MSQKTELFTPQDTSHSRFRVWKSGVRIHGHTILHILLRVSSPCSLGWSIKHKFTIKVHRISAFYTKNKEDFSSMPIQYRRTEIAKRSHVDVPHTCPPASLLPYMYSPPFTILCPWMLVVIITYISLRQLTTTSLGLFTYLHADSSETCLLEILLGLPGFITEVDRKFLRSYQANTVTLPHTIYLSLHLQ